MKKPSLNSVKLTVKSCSEAKNIPESIANNIICICTISLYFRVTFINNFQTVWIYVYLRSQLRKLWFRKVDLKLYIFKFWQKHRDQRIFPFQHVIYSTVKKILLNANNIHFQDVAYEWTTCVIFVKRLWTKIHLIRSIQK